MRINSLYNILEEEIFMPYNLDSDCVIIGGLLYMFGVFFTLMPGQEEGVRFPDETGMTKRSSLLCSSVYVVQGGGNTKRNLGQAHRKHAYQLMANELKMSHVVVSLLYMAIQLVVSLGFIYLCPNTVLAHWVYLIGAAVVLALAYVLFMRKYYHLHEEYLESLKK